MQNYWVRRLLPLRADCYDNGSLTPTKEELSNQSGFATGFALCSLARVIESRQDPTARPSRIAGTMGVP